MSAVRMGELVVSSVAAEEIVAIGLGSCIGLALLDRAAGVAGLVHIVLPESQNGTGPAAKFANTAVPELIDQMRRAGAQRSRLEAAMAGGAKMFALGSGMDIGARNDAAVREALARAQIRVRAAATGGNRGRTVRVQVGDCTVHVQEAGGEKIPLIGDRAPAPRQFPARTIGLGGAGAQL